MDCMPTYIKLKTIYSQDNHLNFYRTGKNKQKVYKPLYRNQCPECTETDINNRDTGKCARGSNENANRLIRRFIPKGVPISNYSQAQIKDIQYWINSYPRKLLKGDCSAVLFRQFLLTLA